MSLYNIQYSFLTGHWDGVQKANLAKFDGTEHAWQQKKDFCNLVDFVESI